MQNIRQIIETARPGGQHQLRVDRGSIRRAAFHRRQLGGRHLAVVELHPCQPGDPIGRVGEIPKTPFGHVRPIGYVQQRDADVCLCSEGPQELPERARCVGCSHSLQTCKQQPTTAIRPNHISLLTVRQPSQSPLVHYLAAQPTVTVNRAQNDLKSLPAGLVAFPKKSTQLLRGKVHRCVFSPADCDRYGLGGH